MKKLFLLSLPLLLSLLLCNCTAQKNQTLPSPLPSEDPLSSTVSSPAEPAGAVRFEQEQVFLKAGGSIQLSAISEQNEKLSFLSDDPDLLYVDQKGKVTAFAEGTANVRVRTASGGLASCKITVAGVEQDPFDELKLREEDKLSYTYYYGKGIEFTALNETVFTPSIWEVDINETNHKGYAIRMRFSKLSPETGERIYTFPSISVTPEINDKGNISLMLQSNDFDSGFCPEADARYDVEVAICAAQSGKVIAHGVFEDVGAVPSVIQYCPYYAPTPLPGLYDKVNGQTTLQYLPTVGGQVTGKPLQILFNGEQGTCVEAEAKEGYEFLMWSDGITTPQRTDTANGKNTRTTAYFIRRSDNLQSVPALYLFTDTGKPVVKKEYQSATLIVRGSGDRSTDITVTTQIKGRGNSSWNGEAAQSDYDSKNSYRLKLDEKQQLLGIGESKNRDWVLNSNKFDLSGLRNFIVWELADRMASFSYVPDCSFAQLYVNGQYRGLYMVTEFIEIANDRVELTESEANDKVAPDKKDYFLEIDFRGASEGLPYFYVEGYGCASNGNEREFVIKNPCTTEDKLYIKQYVQKCHDALVKGDRDEIEKLIDLPSFIDMYILEELSKDVDVGAASCYLQKTADGKLAFTAPWDYDFGFGTFEKAVSYEKMISINHAGCTWFSALVEQKWFRDAVIARMNDLENAMSQTVSALDQKAAELEPAMDENATFWKMYGNRYHPYVDKQVSSALNSYDEHIDFLKSWTASRWQYMINFLSSYGAEQTP